MAENDVARTPPRPDEDVLKTAPQGGETRFGAGIGAPGSPEMLPGSEAANRQAAYTNIPKPVPSGELDPGAGEYASTMPRGAAGTEVAVGSGHHPNQHDSNHSKPDHPPKSNDQ